MGHDFFFWISLINPNWHELCKQEKCSTLAPPRSIFFKDSMRLAWCQINPIDANFDLQKHLEFFNQKLTKSDPKRTGGGKCPPSFQLGLSAGLNLDY